MYRYVCTGMYVCMYDGLRLLPSTAAALQFPLFLFFFGTFNDPKPSMH